jgi:hypothetical protein
MIGKLNTILDFFKRKNHKIQMPMLMTSSIFIYFLFIL